MTIYLLKHDICIKYLLKVAYKRVVNRTRFFFDPDKRKILSVQSQNVTLATAKHYE